MKANERTARDAVAREARDIGTWAVHGAAGAVVFTGIAMVVLPVKMIAMPLAVI